VRAVWSTVVRVCREVAFGVDALNAVRHGRRPSVPPYLPPSLFSVPVRPPVPGPSPRSSGRSQDAPADPSGPYEPRAGTGR
jgi:hypothetical protein